MKVVIDPEANIYEVAEILVKLRHASDKWQNEFGANNRLNKKYWEGRADEWIQNNVKEKPANERVYPMRPNQ